MAIASLLNMSLRTTAEQMKDDLFGNPGQWQTQNGYFVRTGGVGPLAPVQSLPFWIVMRNALSAQATEIADIPAFAQQQTAMVISLESNVFALYGGVELGPHHANNVVILQAALLTLPNATRMNRPDASWAHTSWDGTQI